MNFSEALRELKNGCPFRRKGWNGKDMHIMLVRSENPTFNDYLIIYGTDKKYTPWVASQVDLLAEDWEIV